MLGVLIVLPIGGADMPVVIAVLNSMTGVAAALTGFVLNNQALIIAGILVGASGAFLTLLMARAMNRSVSNVLFGAWGAAAVAEPARAGAAPELPMREATPDDAAVPLAYADKVIIVPGYGLAVAQAQHAVRELAETLQDAGCDVRYAIHPVAGRMPGHMNVLLAEANVPYDDLYEMEQINDDFANTDVAIVVGANDVTNPAARDDPSSPIYGMPILNVDQAKTDLRAEARPGRGVRRHREHALPRPEDRDAFRRCQGLAQQAEHGGEGGIEPASVSRRVEQSKRRIVCRFSRHTLLRRKC